MTTDAQSPPPRRRRWLAHLVRAAVVLILLLVALRYVALAVLPGVLADAAREQGLEVHYERLDVSLTTLDVELWNLVVEQRGAPGAPPLVDVEYVRADVSVGELLAGDLVVHRVELDGAVGHVHRLPDGRWSLTRDGEPLPFLASAPPTDDPGDDAADDTPPPARGEPLSFEPPAALRALRLQHLELHVHDRAVDPPREIVLTGDVRVSHVGIDGRRTKLAVTLSSSPHLGLVRITGEATLGRDTLSTDLDVTLADLRPRVFAGELTALGLQPLAESVGLTLGAHVDLERHADGHFTGRLGLADVALTADGDEAASLGAVDVPVASFDADGLALEEVVVSDVVARTMTDAAGRPVVAGLRFVPTPASPEPPSADDDTPSGPFAFTLAGLRVDRVDLRHELLATTPATSLALVVDALTVGAVALPPTPGAAPIDLTLAAHLPGLVESLSLDASAAIEPDAGRVRLGLRGDDVHLANLRTLLREAGLRTTLVDARLTVDASAEWAFDGDGRAAASLAVTGLALDDGDGTRLVGLESLRVDDLVTPLDDGEALRIEAVALDGLEATGWREADGSWRGLGIASIGDVPPVADAGTPALSRIARRALAEPAPPAPPTDEPDVAPSPPPPLSVGRVTLDAGGVVLVDGLRSRTVTVDTLGLDVDDLRVRDGVPRISSVSLDVGASHALRDLSLDLELTDDGERLGLDGRLDASGLSLVDVAADLGLDDVWLRDGTLGATVSTAWRASDDGLEIDGRIDDLALRQDGVDLLSFDALAVERASFGEQVTIGAFEWDAPRVALTRLDDGRVELLGVTVGGGAPETTADAGGDDASDDRTAPDDAPSGGGLVERAVIRDAGVDWTDVTGSSRVDLDVDVARLGWGELAGPADVALDLSIDDALGSLGFDGVVDTTPEALAATLTLSGRGMRSGALARYLPEGIDVRWDDATLDGSIDALWAAHPDGGHRARLDVTDLRLADATREYLSLPELHVDAPRVDPSGRTYDIDALVLRGLRTAANREADGDVELLGVRLSATADAEPEVAEADEPDDESARERVRDALRQRIVDRASLDVPMTIDVATLDLHVERAEFGDERAPEPYVVRDLRITSTAPVALPREPVELRLEAAVAPLVDRLVVETRLDARAVPAKLAVELTGEGVRVPGTDTRRAVRAKLGADWTSARGEPLRYDEKRGVTVNARLEDVAVADTLDAEARLGFERLTVDALRFQPARNLLTVDAVILRRPIADVVRDAEGLVIGGLRVPTAEPGSPPDETDDDELALDDTDALAPEEPGLAIRVESAIVTGIDAVYQDMTTSPATLFPLDDIDLEVRSIDVDRLAYGHAVPFTMFLRGGKVPPETIGATGAEPMRVLGGLEVNGELAVSPALDGKVDVDVYGLELPALAGLAKASGITLSDGTFDLEAHYVFRGERGLDARNTLVFTDLSASEPSGGLLSKVLLLSVPLQAVIAILRDEVGVIELEVNFSSGAEGLSLAEITRLAATTLSKQLTRAITNSPFRVLDLGVGMAGQVSTVTGLSQVFEQTTRMIGVGDIGEDVPVQLELSFAPGVVEPIGRFEETIATWAELMADDPTLLITLTHEVGHEDIARMEQRVDPPDDELRESVDALRTRRAALLEDRETLVERARAVHAVSRSPESDPVVLHLARVNDELGLVERALDATLELLGPAGERRAELRVGKGCTVLAEARLEKLRARLLADEVGASKLMSLLERRSVRGWAKRIRVQRPRYEPDEDLALSRVVVALERRGE